MVNSTGYTLRHFPERKDTEAEKLGSHWKLKDWNVTAVNRM